MLKIVINSEEFQVKNLAELFKQDVDKKQSIQFLTLHGRLIEYQFQ